MDAEAMAGGMWGPVAPFEDQTTEQLGAILPVEADPAQERLVTAETAPETTLVLPAFTENASVDVVEARRANLPTRLARNLGRRAIGVVEAVKDVYVTGKQEILAASIGARALLGFNAVVVGAEQFGGNETAISNVGVHIYEHTQNIGYTALGAGGTSFAIQAALGILTSVSVAQFPRTVAKIHEKLSARKGVEAAVPVDPEVTGVQAEVLQQPDETTSRASRLNKRFWDAFGLGTSLKSILKDDAEGRTFTKNVKNVVEDAVLVGGGVAALGAIAASLLTASKTAGGIGQDAARYTIDVITSPYPYIGLFFWRLYSEGKGKKTQLAPIPAEGSRF